MGINVSKENNINLRDLSSAMKNKSGDIINMPIEMTLRDYFAGQVLIEFCRNAKYEPNQTAECCYLMADEMIKARDK